MTWQKSHLGEHFEIKHGYAFKGDYFGDSGPYIVLTPGNFYEAGGFRHRGDREKFYTIDPPENYILEEDDLIVAMTEQGEGLLGSSALVPQSDFYLHNQRLGLVVNLNELTLDKHYLYYLFNTYQVRSQIRASATGLKVKHTAPKRIAAVEIELPDITTQKRIAGILSAYDDLIDNNNRRIALLEEAIHRLYREWFVHLRFPGHEQTPIVAGVPEGWEKRPLGEVGFLNYGKSLPKRKREEGTIPVYGSSGIIGTHNKALIPGPSIIVGRKGNVGSAFWCDQPSFPIDTVFYIAPEESNVFLYLNLKHQNFINTDAAVPGLNRNYAHKLPVLMPSESLLLHFEEIAAPVHKQITTLEAYNAKLAEARDALLPRLMNGSLAV
jgi:type I restriction enzyme, S subunit